MADFTVSGGDGGDDLEAALIEAYTENNALMGGGMNGVTMADPTAMKEEIAPAAVFNEQLAQVERGELEQLVWRGLELREHFRMVSLPWIYANFFSYGVTTVTSS